MGFSCGIVGLPNVGKSTLFNVLSKANAESSNYPFCTIEPNVGIVALPDKRLDIISNLFKPKSIIPASMSFTDIAGLVKGANEGQGLGNKFLSHIKEVQAIAQVVRVFEDENIVHIDEIDPIRDIDIILTELRLKDLDTLYNRKKRLEKEARSLKNKSASEEIIFIDFLEKMIENEEYKLNRPLTDIEKICYDSYRLLSQKPMIIVANMGENQIANYKNNKSYKLLEKYAHKMGFDIIALSAKLEEEIISLGEDSSQYLNEMGIKETGLKQFIRKGYDLLNLITFFTAGEKECKAWSIENNLKAPQAAGKIHSDFEKGFIRAEVVSYDGFIEAGGTYQKAREKGKLRVEGKDYIVCDGDIIHFRFNV